MAPIVHTCLRSWPLVPLKTRLLCHGTCRSPFHTSICPSLHLSLHPAAISCQSLWRGDDHSAHLWNTHATHTPPHTPKLACKLTKAPCLTIAGTWSHWRVNESPVLAADLGSVWHQENLECVKRWTCTSLLRGGRYVVRRERRTEEKEEMPQLQTNVESGRQTPADLKNNFFFKVWTRIHCCEEQKQKSI